MIRANDLLRREGLFRRNQVLAGTRSREGAWTSSITHSVARMSEQRRGRGSWELARNVSAVLASRLVQMVEATISTTPSLS